MTALLNNTHTLTQTSIIKYFLSVIIMNEIIDFLLSKQYYILVKVARFGLD